MPSAFKAALTLALFLVLASAGVLLIQTPGTAEFVISVLSLLVGLVFLGVVMLVIRKFSR
jgi:drug/metabolite transporter (DMT)-like permease